MKNFERDFSDDERQAWRDNPITIAFVAWLKNQGDAAKQGALYAAKTHAGKPDAAYATATNYVGQMSAYDNAVYIATKETF